MTPGTSTWTPGRPSSADSGGRIRAVRSSGGSLGVSARGTRGRAGARDAVGKRARRDGRRRCRRRWRPASGRRRTAGRRCWGRCAQLRAAARDRRHGRPLSVGRPAANHPRRGDREIARRHGRGRAKGRRTHAAATDFRRRRRGGGTGFPVRARALRRPAGSRGGHVHAYVPAAAAPAFSPAGRHGAGADSGAAGEVDRARDTRPGHRRDGHRRGERSPVFRGGRSPRAVPVAATAGHRPRVRVRAEP